jgi:broad specificity phosphatase PhoE
VSAELYLLRHGATRDTGAGRYPSAGPGPALDPVGREALRNTAFPWGGDGICGLRVWSSPALRARQTCQVLGLTPDRIHPGLAEADFGVLAGLTWAQAQASYGPEAAAWLRLLADPTSPGGPPRGESGAAFHARVWACLNALPRYPRALWVTHGGVIQAVLRLTGGGFAQLLPGDWLLLQRGP